MTNRLSAFLPAVVLFAQVPSSPPDTLSGFLQAGFYVLGAIVLIVMGTNQVFDLYIKIRGKQALPRDDAPVTYKEFNEHERKDSDRFEKMQQTGGRLEKWMVKLTAALRQADVVKFGHDEDDT